MTKQEFLNLLPVDKQKISDDDYKIIEFVYQFHPAISNADGKKDIAKIYIHFGMSVINDMYPKALIVSNIEKEIFTIKSELNEKLDMLSSISSSYDKEYAYISDLFNEYKVRYKGGCL